MKNYLIVGASSGIGKQLSRQLAEAGHSVYGTYFSHPVQNATDGIHYSPFNVLEDEPDLGFLPDELDGLVYCPGTINLKPFKRIKPESFTEDFNLQVTGAVKVIQACLPRFINEGASIVLFSTVAVQQGFNFHSQVSASKGAIEGLTRALGAELAPKIRVNCIAPSLTDTPLAARLLGTDEKREANAQRHPLKKIGTATDLANAAEFLLSEKSGWMTGQVIHVDGGMSTLKV
ncbi:MAG: SDR family oxidoreductase [Saprospiraceae bacterium]|nr:SDR family oxidoreductase [Saprospiraceae bacterium]MCB9324141.1 SDR family oxidoreductase [Lewinellaceae bacterium]